jgi:hypothetical protein
LVALAVGKVGGELEMLNRDQPFRCSWRDHPRPTTG